MNRPHPRDRFARTPADRAASDRVSGLYPALRVTKADLARAELMAGSVVLVVATCAARALVHLRLNPAHFDAFDAGPVDAHDPLNAAHYYRVRARLPQASR